MPKPVSKQASSKSPSGAGDAAVALETLRALRKDGFAPLVVSVGVVTLHVGGQPGALVPQSASSRRSIVSEYGGPAVQRALGDDAEPDENGLVPA